MNTGAETEVFVEFHAILIYHVGQLMDKKSVLIVEDEFIVALDLKYTLENLGFSVPKVLNSGEKTLEFLNKSTTDCILMDVNLKGNLNGIEAAEKIVKMHNIPVVFITANNKMDQHLKELDSQYFELVLKPFDESELSSAIWKLLQGKET